MGVGPFSSESSTSKTIQTTTVGGQGQLVGRGSVVAQGGSSLFLRSQLAPDIRASGSSTVNYGLTESALNNLVGGLTTASEDQIAAVLALSNNQISAAGQAANKQLDALGGLLTQQRETASGNPTLLAWVAIAAIAAFAWILFKR